MRAEARLSAAPALAPDPVEVHVEAHFEPLAEPDFADAVGHEANGLADAAPAAPKTPPEPLVKPIIIGADAPVQEKKRGWWRR